MPAWSASTESSEAVTVMVPLCGLIAVGAPVGHCLGLRNIMLISIDHLVIRNVVGAAMNELALIKRNLERTQIAGALAVPTCMAIADRYKKFPVRN